MQLPPSGEPSALLLEGKALGRRGARNAEHAAGKVIDSLGRSWDASLHPRDSQGRFIETGGVARVFGVPGKVRIVRAKPRNKVDVVTSSGERLDNIPAERVTMVARPNGTAPIKDDGDPNGLTKVLDEDQARFDHPGRGNGKDSDDDGIPDLIDLDDDNDGVPDVVDKHNDAPAKPTAQKPTPQKPAGPAAAAGERRPGESRVGDFAVLDTPDGTRKIVSVVAVEPNGRIAKYRELMDTRDRDARGSKLRNIAQESVDGAKLRAAIVDYEGPNGPTDHFQDDTEVARLVDKYKVKAKAPRAGRGLAPERKPSGKQKGDLGKPLPPGVTRGGLDERGNRLPDSDGQVRLGYQDSVSLSAPGATRAPQRPTPNVPEVPPAKRQLPAASSLDDQSLEAERGRVERELAALPDGDPGKADLTRRLRTVKAEQRKRTKVAEAAQAPTPAPDTRDPLLAAAQDSGHMQVIPVGGKPNPAPTAPAVPDAPTASAPLDAVEQRRVHLAAVQNAYRYADMDPARYVAEGHLKDLVEKHGLSTVMDAVATDLRRHPEILSYDQGARDRIAAVTKREADQLNKRASDAARAGDFEAALVALGDLELTDPDYRPGGWSIPTLREKLRTSQTEALAKRVDQLERHDTITPTTTPEGAPSDRADVPGVPDTRPAGDGVRGDRREVLADVPAERAGDDPAAAAGGVLPEPGPAGRGRGDVPDAGQPAGGPAGERAAGAAGTPSADGARPSGARGSRRAGVRNVEGTRDGEPRAAAAAGVTDQVDEPVPGAQRFTPQGQQDLAPAAPKDKARANLDAIKVRNQLNAEGRPATQQEQGVLARWAGWGALPQMFKPAGTRGDFESEGEELRQLLTPEEWEFAFQNTANAHYTDAAIVDEMWRTLRGLGFDGGEVLEAGSGSGNFIGRAPRDARMTGVERDPVTADISHYLYPDATIRKESFGDTPVKEGDFDAAIGNVPFSGDIHLFDQVHNPNRGMSIHNHFIAKELAGLKPGGVAAFITSAHTLNAGNGDARKRMYEQADLIGAVRLPSGAHAAAANTDVVTDMLVFRKRMPGEEPGDSTWLTSSPGFLPDGTPLVGRSGSQLPISDYFTANPENVLGQYRNGGWNGVAVDGDPRLVPSQMQARLDAMVEQARQDGRIANPTRVVRATAVKKRRASATPKAPAAGVDKDLYAEPSERTKARKKLIGQITHTGTRRVAGKKDGAEGSLEHTFSIVDLDGEEVVYDAPGAKTAGTTNPKKPSQADELTRLLRLRDVKADLMDAEKETTEDTPEVLELRAELNRLYDGYVKKYGPIGRVKTTKVKVEPKVGPDGELDTDGLIEDDGEWFRPGQVKPQLGGIRRDPSWWSLLGLETDYDEATNTAKKSSQFTKRQIGFRAIPTTADTPEDALQVSLEFDGKVDLHRVASLLGIDPADARDALGNRVFIDHETGDLVPARLYLSGNVRQKARDAREAAKADPRLEPNVAALEAVIPPDKDPTKIKAKLGMSWIDPNDFQQFVRDLTGNRGAQVRRAKDEDGKQTWKVVVGSGGNRNPSKEGGRAAVPYDHDGQTPILTQWGTGRRTTYDLVESLLKQGRPVVEDTHKDPTGKTYKVLNKAETDAAVRKAEQIQAEFGKWLWRDEERKARLQTAFNEKYRAYTDVNYVDSPMRLYPGMSDSITLDPHQNDAVTMNLNLPSQLLDHEVGTGKSFTNAAIIMERRRLGMNHKPVLVVPNHLLEQSVREFKVLYPDAKILAADSSATSPDKRRQFVAQAGGNDWDVVVMTANAFQAIPLSEARNEEKAQAAVSAARAKRDQAIADGKTADIKKWGAKLQEEEEKLKELQARLNRDKGGLDFEAIGFDYLVVDEAHEYKNDLVETDIPGLAKDKAKIAALDLREKLDYLRATAEKRGVKGVATFASGTPVSNSTREFYVMARYLRPDLLEQAGIHSFDDFAAQYLQMRESVEQTVTGALQIKTREGDELVNAGELKRLWVQFADTVTADDVGLERPKLAGGQAEKIVGEMSPLQTRYVASLKPRRDAITPTRKPEKGADTVVAVGTDGLTSAVDLRLLPDHKLRAAGIDPAEVGIQDSKVPLVGDAVLAEWRRTKDMQFSVSKADRTPHPTLGAAQIVFADKGTPKADGQHSFYQSLKDYLVEGGLRPEEVAFIHDAAGDPVLLGKLSEKVRTGEVKVLIGSTPKMGTGLNVQNRLSKLHHVDGAYRPDQIEQRNGRVVRRGNQNDEVAIAYYPLANSTEGFQWAHTSRKDNFLRQFAQADLDATIVGRQESETGSEADMLAALAANNPLLLDQVQVDSALRTMEGDRDTAIGSQEYHADVVRKNTQAVRQIEQQISDLGKAQEQVVDTSGDKFQFTPTDRFGRALPPVKARKDAAEQIATNVRAMLESHVPQGEGILRQVGTLGGLDLYARTYRGLGKPEIEFHVKKPGSYGSSQMLDLRPAVIDPAKSIDHNTVARLENLVAGIPARQGELRGLIRRKQDEIGVSEVERHKGYAEQAELDALTARRDALGPLMKLESDAAAQLERSRKAGNGEGLPPETARALEDARAAYNAATSRWRELRDERLNQGTVVQAVEMGAARTSRRKVKQQQAELLRSAQASERRPVTRVRQEDATFDAAGRARDVDAENRAMREKPAPEKPVERPQAPQERDVPQSVEGDPTPEQMDEGLAAALADDPDGTTGDIAEVAGDIPMDAGAPADPAESPGAPAADAAAEPNVQLDEQQSQQLRDELDSLAPEQDDAAFMDYLAGGDSNTPEAPAAEGAADVPATDTPDAPDASTPEQAADTRSRIDAALGDLTDAADNRADGNDRAADQALEAATGVDTSAPPAPQADAGGAGGDVPNSPDAPPAPDEPQQPDDTPGEPAVKLTPERHDGLTADSGVPAPAKPTAAEKAKAKRNARPTVFDERYGDVTQEQRRAYRAHNVSQSDHDELVGHYGEADHAGITDAVKDPANQQGGSFSTYLWRRNIDAAQRDEPTSEERDKERERSNNRDDRNGHHRPNNPLNNLPHPNGPDLNEPPHVNEPPAGAAAAAAASSTHLTPPTPERTSTPDAPGTPEVPATTEQVDQAVDDAYQGTTDPADLDRLGDTLADTGADATPETPGTAAMTGTDTPEQAQPTAEELAGTSGGTDDTTDLPRGVNDGAPVDPPQGTPDAVAHGGLDAAAEPDAPMAPDAADEAPDAPADERPAPEAIDGEKFPPTRQQQDVYDAVLAGRNVKVQAGAGAGKTSTLEGMARRVALADPRRRIGYVAFNKSVQIEAQRRMPHNTESRTGHSLGWAFAGSDLTAKFDRHGMLSNGNDLARHYKVTADLPNPGGKPLAPAEQARAAQAAVDAWANSADDTIGSQHLPQFAATLDPAGTRSLIALADRMWADIKTPTGKQRITNDHMRKMWALSRPDLSKDSGGFAGGVDLLFLDEAQDTPPVLAKVIEDQAIQKVIVGDQDQAIYGFTGAVDYLAQATADDELPLTKSWRYGPEVAEMGNRFLQLLDSPKRVEGGGASSTVHAPGTLENADAILVRSNGGAIGEILREQEAGRVVGVTKGTKADLLALVDTARWLKGRRSEPKKVHEDLQAFRSWDEVEKAVEDEGDPKLAMLTRLLGKYGEDGLEDIVRQVIDPNDGGMAGINIAEDDTSITLTGETGPLNNRLKKLPGAPTNRQGKAKGISQVRGFTWDGTRGAWVFRGDTTRRAAALDQLRELAGGDSRKPDVTVTTAHKAKGLEWGKVRIGDDFRGPKVDPDTGDVTMPEPEELRLAYVALTRAETDLDPGSLAWVREHTDENGGSPGSTPGAPGADVPSAAATDGAPAGDVPGDAPATAVMTPEDVAALTDSNPDLLSPRHTAGEDTSIPGEPAAQADEPAADTPAPEPTPASDEPAAPEIPSVRPPAQPQPEPTPEPTAPAEPPAAPVDDGGPQATWVQPGELQLGDTVRFADAVDVRGRKATAAGVLTALPTPATVRRRNGKTTQMLKVSVADDVDGTNARTFYIPTDGLALRGPVPDGTVPDGAPTSGADLEVLHGDHVPDMPSDSTGEHAVFPGSTVTDRTGQEGVVTDVIPEQAHVKWDGDKEADVRPGTLTVTDDGEARPEGWTETGQQVEPGDVVQTDQGPAVVEDVEGDTLTVRTPDGDTTEVPAQDAHLVPERPAEPEQAPDEAAPELPAEPASAPEPTPEPQPVPDPADRTPDPQVVNEAERVAETDPDEQEQRRLEQIADDITAAATEAESVHQLREELSQLPETQDDAERLAPVLNEDGAGDGETEQEAIDRTADRARRALTGTGRRGGRGVSGRVTTGSIHDTRSPAQRAAARAQIHNEVANEVASIEQALFARLARLDLDNTSREKVEQMISDVLSDAARTRGARARRIANAATGGQQTEKGLLFHIGKLLGQIARAIAAVMRTVLFGGIDPIEATSDPERRAQQAARVRAGMRKVRSSLPSMPQFERLTSLVDGPGRPTSGVPARPAGV